MVTANKINEATLNRINEIMDHYWKVERYIIEPLKQLRKETERYIEPLSQLLKETEPNRLFIQQCNESLDAINREFENLNQIHLRTPIFNNPLTEQYEKNTRFGTRIKKLIERTPGSLLLLAEYGWYLEYDSVFSLPVNLAEL